MKFVKNGLDFEIELKNGSVLKQNEAMPMLYVGYGEPSIEMYRGNFKIEDYVVERYPLKVTEIVETDLGYEVNFSGEIKSYIYIQDDEAKIGFEKLNPKINRFWLRVLADADEKCYGCGEQMSYFNLRGRHFPLWSSEPGVGRDKSTYLTWRYDQEAKAGGDYYNTNYPQATYVSSRHYYLHTDCTAYADFDFRHEAYHELQYWEVPDHIHIAEADTFLELMTKLTDLLGRQPELPDWIYDGAIIGVQGGTDRSFGLTDRSVENGIKVCGIWCQDWEGKRVTSFGKRLQWDWRWNEEMYPNLPEKMKEYREKGIRFLGYINPYLVNDGVLYKEGKEKGYFATAEDGSDYLVDFGEFYCGVVDFTNPDAYEWFKGIIKKNLIEFGLSGWMADFGEYLPTDLKLHNGVSPMLEHNHWPALWAKCNYDALKETRTLGEIVYFMRAGATGSQKYCTLMWAGDQSVDFTLHDGLATVMVGALSVGMCGCGLHHSDIGGYTSIYDNIRTKELFERWTEMAAFTPVMRTHEGNRPDTNFQYYDDVDTMKMFARMTDIHVDLKDYIRETVKENAGKGIPVQRPLFMHYEDEKEAYDIQTEYLFGRDMLVAPVYLEGAQSRSVYLPEDTWIHLFTGELYGGGTYEIEAPIGYPPVFYRKDAGHADLFKSITDKYKKV